MGKYMWMYIYYLYDLFILTNNLKSGCEFGREQGKVYGRFWMEERKEKQYNYIVTTKNKRNNFYKLHWSLEFPIVIVQTIKNSHTFYFTERRKKLLK